MKVLLLGFTVPEASAKRLFDVDSMPAIQTHKFAWSLARSLRMGSESVVLASTYPIQNYPRGRELFFRGQAFREQEFEGILLGFVNLLVLKHLTRFLSCLMVLPGFMRRHEVKWIVIHGVHTPFLVFGALARLFGKKLAVMLTDPPGVILPTDGPVSRVLKMVDAWLVKYLVGFADAIFALAPELAARIAPEKPAVIFPGILEERIARLAIAQRREDKEDVFTIVYAGGLSKAYGVDRLIDAVAAMVNPSVRLKLFGRGDQESRARQLAMSDPRFTYGGFVGNEVLIPELCGADLLINPRPTEQSFAVQSFPSKLIEYLATGRPVLTTRIKSMPASYGPHFLYIDDETVPGIQFAIEQVMALPKEVRHEQGRQAVEFVRADASEQAIGKRIMLLLASIDRNI